MFMGNIELPGGATGSKQTIKMPVGTYEFGANLISEKGVSAWVGATEAVNSITNPVTATHTEAETDSTADSQASPCCSCLSQLCAVSMQLLAKQGRFDGLVLECTCFLYVHAPLAHLSD